MRLLLRATTIGLAALLATALAAAPLRADDCGRGTGGLGVSRVVEIDAAAGPLYGDITRYAKEESFLAPGEVVLTFDDGPMPWITKSILDTLDRFCTKATFFSVGRMALAYPSTVREVLTRGHTLGGHTHTHPLNIARLSAGRATDEIERGFAAIALAAGQPIAPFFRFPGLSDSPALLAHLQERGIATFTVDVVSNDSFIGDAGRLARLTLERVEARKGGILLFHDIKAATAKALPVILGELKARGYKVVHMRAKTPLAPLTTYDAELAPILARSQPKSGGDKAAMVPFYGTIGPERAEPRAADPATVAAVASTPAPAPLAAPVTQLAPERRQRLAALSPATLKASEASAARRQRAHRREAVRASASPAFSAPAIAPAVGGWSTEIRPARRPRAAD